MFRNVLNALRTSHRPTTAAASRKVRLHVEGSEERACPTTIRQRAAALGWEIVAASKRFVLDAAVGADTTPRSPGTLPAVRVLLGELPVAGGDRWAPDDRVAPSPSGPKLFSRALASLPHRRQPTS
jgi:hypothetical protein